MSWIKGTVGAADGYNLFPVGVGKFKFLSDGEYYYGKAYIYIGYKITKSAEANSSILKFNLFIDSFNANSNYEKTSRGYPLGPWSGVDSTIQLYGDGIAGKTYTFDGTLKGASSDDPVKVFPHKILSEDRTYTMTHNANTGKPKYSEIKFKFNWTVSPYSTSDFKSQLVFVADKTTDYFSYPSLPVSKIPSTISCDKNVYIGNNIQLKIGASNAKYTHKFYGNLKKDIGDKKGGLILLGSLGAGKNLASVKIPFYFCSNLTKGTGSLDITCVTYNSTEKIGESKCTTTLKFNKDYCTPKINEIIYATNPNFGSDLGDAVADAYGYDGENFKKLTDKPVCFEFAAKIKYKWVLKQGLDTDIDGTSLEDTTKIECIKKVIGTLSPYINGKEINNYENEKVTSGEIMAFLPLKELDTNTIIFMLKTDLGGNSPLKSVDPPPIYPYRDPIISIKKISWSLENNAGTSKKQLTINYDGSGTFTSFSYNSSKPNKTNLKFTYSINNAEKFSLETTLKITENNESPYLNYNFAGTITEEVESSFQQVNNIVFGFTDFEGKTTETTETAEKNFDTTNNTPFEWDNKEFQFNVPAKQNYSYPLIIPNRTSFSGYDLNDEIFFTIPLGLPLSKKQVSSLKDITITGSFYVLTPNTGYSSVSVDGVCPGACYYIENMNMITFGFKWKSLKNSVNNTNFSASPFGETLKQITVAVTTGKTLQINF